MIVILRYAGRGVATGKDSFENHFIMSQASLSSHTKRRPGRPVSYVVESGDATDVRKVFGLREGKLYQLQTQGLVKSVLLKVPGAARGKRIYDFSSIRKLLALQKDEKATS